MVTVLGAGNSISKDFIAYISETSILCTKGTNRIDEAIRKLLFARKISGSLAYKDIVLSGILNYNILTLLGSLLHSLPRNLEVTSLYPTITLATLPVKP